MKNSIARVKAALSVCLGRFFYTRPSLKRAALIAALYAAPTLAGVLAVSAVLVGAVWALILLALFWGMGAERAATEWDSMFSLPPLSAFAFWRWHGLEKKRFIAVFATLATGWLVTISLAVLS